MNKDSDFLADEAAPPPEEAPKPASGRKRKAKSGPKENNNFDSIVFYGQRYQLPLIDNSCETKERILISATILFAKQGYASVSIRDIAKANDIKPSSIYNHFESKEALWVAILEHLKKLCILYFENLDKALRPARTFEELVAIMLYEPKRFHSQFTTYGFTLINHEQINDPLAGEAFCMIFNHGARFIEEKFDECVARGLVQPFDTRMMATIFISSMYFGLTTKVQELEGRPAVFKNREMLEALERLILKVTGFS